MRINRLNYLILTLVLGCFSLPLQAKIIGKVSSPNKKYRFEVISNEKGLQYQVRWDGKVIINPSALGLTYSSGAQLTDAKVVLDIERDKENDVWKPVYGEQNYYVDKYNELTIDFGKTANATEEDWSLTIRAYNEGVAFKYELEGDNAKLKSENTEFRFVSTANVWVSDRAQSSIYKQPASKLVGKNIVERPLLVEFPEKDCYMALGEAKVVNFPRMKFGASKTEDNQVVLGARLSSDAVLSDADDNMETPWRYIMAGKQPSELLQNNGLLLNLNDECELDDVSWIKPGKVLREVTLTTEGTKACVDFAKRNNIEYIMFDAGWYGPENSMASDATTVTLDPARSAGPFSMPEILSYSKAKDVGIILYVNRRALERQDAEAFKLYESWGNIVGIKYGFVNVGSQHWTNWLHESIKLAAKHKLMVDVHDEYRPTGWSRTYPHFLTQEGIRGDEESATNDDVIRTIFTRMIAGPGDQTNCYYASRVEDKMGSRASQMAKMVCVYSPFQSVYWYDRPVGAPHKAGGAGGAESIILENDETKFYSQVPTVWDETQVIEGYPGEYARIARRSGDTWFMGALAGSKGHQFNVEFDFLGSGDFEATIYTDNIVNGNKEVKIETVKVDKKSKMDFGVLPKNGFAMIIKPIK